MSKEARTVGGDRNIFTNVQFSGHLHTQEEIKKGDDVKCGCKPAKSIVAPETYSLDWFMAHLNKPYFKPYYYQ